MSLVNHITPLNKYICRLRQIYKWALITPFILLGVSISWPAVRPIHLTSLLAKDLIELQMSILIICASMVPVSLVLCWVSLWNYIRTITDLDQKLKAYYRLFVLKMSILLSLSLVALVPVFLMPEQYAYNFAGFALLGVLLAIIANQPTVYRLEKHLRFSEAEWQVLNGKPVMVQEVKHVPNEYV